MSVPHLRDGSTTVLKRETGRLLDISCACMRQTTLRSPPVHMQLKICVTSPAKPQMAADKSDLSPHTWHVCMATYLRSVSIESFERSLLFLSCTCQLLSGLSAGALPAL